MFCPWPNVPCWHSRILEFNSARLTLVKKRLSILAPPYQKPVLHTDSLTSIYRSYGASMLKSTSRIPCGFELGARSLIWSRARRSRRRTAKHAYSRVKSIRHKSLLSIAELHQPVITKLYHLKNVPVFRHKHLIYQKLYSHLAPPYGIFHAITISFVAGVVQHRRFRALPP